MPRKDSIKIYLKGGYYHVYNRGVEKRKIFLDEQDFRVFLSYLKTYLTFKDEILLKAKLMISTISPKEREEITRLLALNNFYKKIKLLSFCLKTNHFHFLLKQEEEDAMDLFMNSLCTRYTMYFNKKYKRVGHLFEGTYKAVLVDNDSQLAQVSRYIHRQALRVGITGKWRQKTPSSFINYLGLRTTTWIDTKEILLYFGKNNSQLTYESFVVGGGDDRDIANLIIED